MPTYEFACKKGHHFERILPVADYRTPQSCECGSPGRRVISIPRMVSVQRECRYDSPVTGRPISSYKQRAEDLARHGCQPYDPGMKADADRFRERSQAAVEKSLDDSVDRAYEAMPTSKREKLDNEIKAGAGISVERS